MKDKKIKMIALDLDGTTLNKKGEFTKSTLKAFRAAMDKGIHIVISTGRTFKSLPRPLFTIDGLEYVVTSNGAQITELTTMKVIYENYIAPHAVEEVARILGETRISVETFVGGKAYIDKAEYDSVKSSGSAYRDVEYIIQTRNPVPGILDYMVENKHRIENISVNFQFIEDKEKWRSVFENIDDITLTSSFAHNFEIGGDTTSKAEALRFLMSRLSVEQGELMACGDSPNDAEMIKLAGVGVAVANAAPEIKAIANYITASNEEDGVARAIAKFAI